MKKVNSCYIAVANFSMVDPKTNKPRPIIPGEVLEGLSDTDANILFMDGHIEPQIFPEESLYKAIRPGSYQTPGGILTTFSPGEMVYLTKTEALDLMRRKIVIPTDILLRRLVSCVPGGYEEIEKYKALSRA